MKNRAACDSVKAEYSEVEDFMSDGSIIWSNPVQTVRLLCRDEQGNECSVEDAEKIGVSFAHNGNMYHKPDYQIKWY